MIVKHNLEQNNYEHCVVVLLFQSNRLPNFSTNFACLAINSDT